jgi:hypothetical protein
MSILIYVVTVIHDNITQYIYVYTILSELLHGNIYIIIYEHRLYIFFNTIAIDQVPS